MPRGKKGLVYDCLLLTSYRCDALTKASNSVGYVMMGSFGGTFNIGENLPVSND